MIQNWDIISRIDTQTKSLLYALVIDGTEHDARLISKKLAGYAQAPTAAVAPFVYQFELPCDMDEGTLDKIRTAVTEGISQTNKVNQFVPGGVLGEPLFNQDVAKEDKDFPTFITLDPSESFFRPSGSGEDSANRVSAGRGSIDLDTPTGIDLQKQVISPQTEEAPTGQETAPQAQPPSGQPAPAADGAPAKEAAAAEESNPINDKDMLIKDMEGTLLDQMPLDDIFEAKTKYDMFLDLNNPKSNQQANAGRNAKLNNLADGKDSLEETFNVFEQKIKDETCFMDLDAQGHITKRTPAAKPEPDAAAPDTNAAHAAAGGTTQPEPGPAQMPEEVEILNTVAPVAGVKVRHFNVTEHKPANPDTDLPEITIREQVDDLDKTFNLETTINKETLQRTFQKTLNTDAPDMARPLRTETTAMREMRERQETLLREGIAPQQKQTEQPGAAAPEAQNAGAQRAPNQSTSPEETLQPTAPAGSVQQPVPGTHTGQEAARPKHATFRIKLKKPQEQRPAPAQTDLHLQNDKKADSVMEENHEAKLTFRIRRKEPLTQPPAPLHPAAPQPGPATPAQAHPQPQTPQTPAHAATPAQPAQAAPRPAALGPNSSGNNIEKTKTIDHSIELPLSELKKHNWPLEVPLVPTYTLENMVISVNRFAHATTVSVIDSPGKLYNPLVLFGPAGTGKTHFLNAIGYAMSQKLGQENIFLTNGVRLSRGIQRYVMEGNIDKFEKFMDSVKVLLIDDIHLIAVNEQNRVHLSKLLNKFLKAQKQIVITSKYPPESLAKLEELINFKLDSGWISELKSAHGPAHFKIVKKMLSDNGIELTDAQVESFFGAPNMTLSTVSRSIRRIKVLEQLIFPGLEGVDRSQAMILEKLLATQGEDQTSAIMKRSPEEITSLPPFGKGEWGRIGFFYPQNSSNMMNWMVYALSERAKELGIDGSFEIAVRSSYATENVISSAFKIANLCDNKKLKGAVILGPSLQVCDPSVRENFYDILTHMLEVMLIRCGIINMEDVSLPSTYVKLISELLR